ncbi:MAG TPA: cell envelope integrity protein CreD [Daejeonella sp.]|uniref:cell envelope integrity protein CreD n=1 Tax=Daejeonella sp. TaxID=2805397 RepID=UPI002ED7A34D
MKIELTTENKGFNNWFGGSVLIKLGLIGFLTILLLIPSSLIQDLIAERQNRQEEVIREISDKWSGSQLVQGPVLVLPYKTTVIAEDPNTSKSSTRETLTNIYILPETLNISSKANPEMLHRGIFDAVVYNSKIQVNGKFSPLELTKSNIDPAMIQWDKAKVAIGLTDLKGLKNNPIIRLGNENYEAEPDLTSLKLFSNNLIILPNLSSNKDTALSFSFDLDLRGSEKLSFLHLGKNTTVKIEGEWNNPSFTGRYLPDERSVSGKGFSATWKMPYYNRPYPQQWIEENTILNKADTLVKGNNNPDTQATFGVDFLLPVDQYQKTTRAAKYAILVILLSFLSLFFTELLNKRNVHFLQYVLIGAAMTIYYTLLLALSEQVGFNAAYIIASLATISLIGTFIWSLLKNSKAALLFSGILSMFYGFIFVILQLQDMALLVGSVGLFVIIAALMYLSQKISWEQNKEEEPNVRH